ncbi:hypothetical protein E2C01_094588 [Portunus trituberculatus]|uniref:Reverse transcriptase domain-containing protein n=1 Tax=Portunus trituberculatus TaxID=210409 RepID=A0A5B7JWH3_PORTR|nr:hypothetical protein [Portunus trituberculatus]
MTSESKAHTPGFYNHMFMVPKSTTKHIIDHSILNTYIITTKFKMEMITTVMFAIHQNNWTVLLNLEDFYLQVPIHQESQCFLHFTWKSIDSQFQVLCFSLSIAPHIFTYLMAPVSIKFHRQGFRILHYLDD